MNPATTNHCLLALSLLSLLLLATSLPLNGNQNASRRSAIDVSRMLNLLRARPDKIEARSITAFVTDPALLVTILHSLEVAYWTLPFGFILTPIINLFRMPNRRQMKGRLDGENVKMQQFYQTLAKAIDKIEKLNGRARTVKSTATTDLL